MKNVSKRKRSAGTIIGPWLLSIVLTGVTFAASPLLASMLQVEKYAVIIVGSNENDGEQMHFPFKHTGDRVYSTLKQKGFTDENILYLSWEYDPNNPGAPVDQRSIKKKIRLSLELWLQGNLNIDNDDDETVVIYFIDHGDIDQQTSSYFFVSYDYLVYDSELSTWINNALTKSDGSKNYGTAAIVIETCHSGMLLDPNLGIVGPDRIVISSTDDVNEAYFWWAPPQVFFDERPAGSYGEAIFSYYFMMNLALGSPLSIEEAFAVAQPQTTNEVFRLSRLAYGPGGITLLHQYPQIDDQCPGLTYW